MCAALTQVVEYVLGKDEVGGSSPLGSSTKNPAFRRSRGFVFNLDYLLRCLFRSFLCIGGFIHTENRENHVRYDKDEVPDCVPVSQGD